MDFECIWNEWRIIGIVIGVVGLIFSVVICGFSAYYGCLAALASTNTDLGMFMMTPIFRK